ncbi:MAG: Rdx family protein [Anaerolineae bacterium]|nr:Rdx family protein [Anaerolineae bacterium]
MTAEILKEREIEIYVGSWKLIPGSSGVFEVTVNGELIFSKKTLKRHAEPGEVRAAILRKLDEIQPNRPALIKDDSD